MSKIQMRPLAPTARIERNHAAHTNPPTLGITIIIDATRRASAIPTKITVRKEERRILRNRLRIEIPRSTNAFDAIRAILQASDLPAQIADMRVDAAIVR